MDLRYLLDQLGFTNEPPPLEELWVAAQQENPLYSNVAEEMANVSLGWMVENESIFLALADRSTELGKPNLALYRMALLAETSPET